MIKFIKGDLIKLIKEDAFDIVMHGANCFCTMGSGIAYQMRINFPELYNADLQTKSGDKSKVGTYTYYLKQQNAKVMNQHSRNEYKYTMLINAYTQYTYGNRKDLFEYAGFESILKSLIPVMTYKKIGLPLIGCGLAGGDKTRILKIIEDTIGHLDVTIVEYDNT